jgi:ABC-type multidrug transport system fused ATPase/permease subunit
MNMFTLQQAVAAVFVGLMIAAQQQSSTVVFSAAASGGARFHYCTSGCPYDIFTSVPPNGTLDCAERGLTPLLLTCSSGAFLNVTSRAEIAALGGEWECELRPHRQYVAITLVTMAFMFLAMATYRHRASNPGPAHALFRELRSSPCGNRQPKADLMKALTATKKVLDVIERKSEIDAFDESGTRLDACTGPVELIDVEFAYPAAADVLVCRGYSLSIGSGQTVALCGQSGSGKSTIVSLLERFYDPKSGSLTLDGTPQCSQLPSQNLRVDVAVKPGDSCDTL